MRASADGRLAVSGTDVRTVSVRILPARRPQPRSPGLARGRGGRPWPATTCPFPPQRLTAPLRRGPRARPSTAPRCRPGSTARAPRSGARATCGGWRVPPSCSAPGPPTTSSCRGDAALRPASVALVGAGGGRRAPAPTPLDVTPQSPTHLTGTVGAGPQRLLALAMNHNDGWEADARRPAPSPRSSSTASGRASSCPTGPPGALEVRFAPDGALPRRPSGSGCCSPSWCRSRCSSPTGRGAPCRAAGDPDAVPRAGRRRPRRSSGGALLVAGPWAALAAAAALAALHLRARAP